MRNHSQKYSETYFKYHRIGDNAYREKVRYYEENPQEISLLHFDERLEIDIDYCICLFEIGRYHRFLERVDLIIESIIEENIFDYNNENIFNSLLLKKAAALYNLNKFKESEFVLAQLIKIDPKLNIAKQLYGLCKRRKEDNITTLLKAAGMTGLLIALSITVVRILLIEPFYDQYLEPFLTIRNVILAISFFSFTSIEIYLNYTMYKETGSFSNSLLNWLFKKR
ncbi:MAG: hypothetical protein IPM42_11600 [Saprospiraceae bacterium]|nr:hypothetical protein [Saprospiraceae bacterium]